MTLPIVATLLKRAAIYQPQGPDRDAMQEAAALIEKQGAVIAAASALLNHWDRNGAEYCSEYDGDVYWSPAARSIDTEYVVAIRAALASLGNTEDPK